MNQTNRALMCMLICLMASSRAAMAQDIGGKSTVTGTGQGIIKAQPDLLRITLQLEGTGKDARDALAKLAQEKESAKTKFAGLGVAAEQIQASDPALGASGTSTQIRAMQMAMGMRQGRRAAGSAPAGGASAVTVSSTIQAELPLKASSVEEKLIEGAEVTDKIKAAFARALSGEEQELMEEMQQMGRGEGSIPRVGEPQFLFVHVIGDAERNRATTDAVAEAKESATRLASAAGGKLGTVRQISGDGMAVSAQGDQNPDGYAGYNAYTSNVFQYRFNRSATAGAGTAGPAAAEAISAQPGQLTYVVRVTVLFSLD